MKTSIVSELKRDSIGGSVGVGLNFADAKNELLKTLPGVHEFVRSFTFLDYSWNLERAEERVLFTLFRSPRSNVACA